MAGGGLVVLMVFFGLAGGYVGRMKGSSFFLWFAISAIPPFFGLLAAIFYRFERDEPDTACPRCGKRVKFYEALCTRCGQELDPGYTEQPSSAAQVPPA